MEGLHNITIGDRTLCMYLQDVRGTVLSASLLPNPKHTLGPVQRKKLGCEHLQLKLMALTSLLQFYQNQKLGRFDLFLLNKDKFRLHFKN